MTIAPESKKSTQEFCCYTKEFENLVGLKITRLTLESKLESSGLLKATAYRYKGETENEYLYIYIFQGCLFVNLNEREWIAQTYLRPVGVFKNFTNLTIEEIADTFGWVLPKIIEEFI